MHDFLNPKFKKGLMLGGLIGGALVGLCLSDRARGMRRRALLQAEEIFDELKDRARELQDATQELYDAAVDRVVEEVTAKKELARDMKDMLARDLKNRWREFQVYSLFRQVKDRLTNTMDTTKEQFENMVDEVVAQYADKKSLAIDLKESLIREVKRKWKEFQEETM